MDAKDLRTQPTLCSDRYNESSKYAGGVDSLQCDRNKSYQELGSNTLAKVDIPSVRPCAVIGPDRVVPPTASTDSYLKKTSEPWPSGNDTYRRPPEYPHNLPSYLTPTRNISPRQTFQENMQRIMVPLTYNSTKQSDDNYAQIPDRNSAQPKNIKLNVPSEAKYCDVPYTVNPNGIEQKNVRSSELCVSSGNLPVPRNAPPGWPPTGGNLRSRPYAGPDLYPYQEYPSCAGPRPVVTRSHRTPPEEGYVYPEPYYQDGNNRFKPYPTVKDRYPPRYEYIANYTNPFHPPPPFPSHRYDLQKPVPPHFPPYASVKYVDNRVVDTVLDGYQRNQPGNFGVPYRNPIVPAGYPQVHGTGPPHNKMHPYNYDGSVKQMPPNKLIYDQHSKNFLEYENSRQKIYPSPDGYFVNEMGRIQPMKNQMIMPNYPNVNMHQVPSNPYYKKDNAQIKHLEYMSHMKNMDPNLNIHNIMPRHPMFSPNTLTMSPTDSNTSNDTILTLGNAQEDCGYVSQSSTTSIRSMDSGANRGLSDYYRRYYDSRPMHLVKTSPMLEKTDINTNNASKNKKQINVRQFLQMWSEGDDETDEHKDIKAGTNEGNNFNKTQEAHNQEQLYVLGYVNVSQDELGKYEHIQKVSKLPENIKGYSNIDLLNQFEEVIESTNSNHFKTSKLKDNFQLQAKPLGLKQPSFPSRPLSPLDVEAKISQSIIHKEVGCNFEIRPCSPKMLNVDVAAPVQNILAERTIEKVTNPVMLKSPNVHGVSDSINFNIMHRPDSRLNNDILRNTSCKMINSQFSNNSSDDTMKNIYSVQDLESNSGLCLASLPRLDNDIELTFPEVNQQFINANKVVPSVITTPKDLPLLDVAKNVEKNNESKELGQDIKITETPSESEKEFTKLSKYRKIKTNCLIGGLSPGVDKPALTKEDEKRQNVNVIRTDSVIMKNPENPKHFEDLSVNSMIESDNTLQQAPINLASNSTPPHCEVDTAKSEIPADIAIDFSLNKHDSSNSFSVLDETESKISIFSGNSPNINTNEKKYNIENETKYVHDNFTCNNESIIRKPNEADEYTDTIDTRLNEKTTESMLHHESIEVDNTSNNCTIKFNIDTLSGIINENDRPHIIAQNQPLIKLVAENHDDTSKICVKGKENMDCEHNLNLNIKTEPQSTDASNTDVAELLHQSIQKCVLENEYKEETKTTEVRDNIYETQSQVLQNTSLEITDLNKTCSENVTSNRTDIEILNENVVDIDLSGTFGNVTQVHRNVENKVDCNELVMNVDKNATSSKSNIGCASENILGSDDINTGETKEDTAGICVKDYTTSSQINESDSAVENSIKHDALMLENESDASSNNVDVDACKYKEYNESDNINNVNLSKLVEPLLDNDLSSSKMLLKNCAEIKHTSSNDTEYGTEAPTDNTFLHCTEFSNDIRTSGHVNNVVNTKVVNELQKNNTTLGGCQLLPWRKEMFSPYIQNLIVYHEGNTNGMLVKKITSAEYVLGSGSVDNNVKTEILESTQFRINPHSHNHDNEKKIVSIMAKDSSIYTKQLPCNNSEQENISHDNLIKKDDPAFKFGSDNISPMEDENIIQSSNIHITSPVEDSFKISDIGTSIIPCDSLPIVVGNADGKLEDLVSKPILSMPKEDLIAPTAFATDFPFKYPSEISDTNSVHDELNGKETVKFEYCKSDDTNHFQSGIEDTTLTRLNFTQYEDKEIVEPLSQVFITVNKEETTPKNEKSCDIEIKSDKFKSQNSGPGHVDETSSSNNNEFHTNMNTNEKMTSPNYHTNTIKDTAISSLEKHIDLSIHDKEKNIILSNTDLKLQDNLEISAPEYELLMHLKPTSRMQNDQEIKKCSNDEHQSQANSLNTSMEININKKPCDADNILPLHSNDIINSKTNHENILNMTDSLKNDSDIYNVLPSGFSLDRNKEKDILLKHNSTQCIHNTKKTHDNAEIENSNTKKDSLLDSNTIPCCKATVSPDELNSSSSDTPEESNNTTQGPHTLLDSFNRSTNKTKLKRSLSDSALNQSNLSYDFKQVNEQNLQYVWSNKRRKLNIESLEEEFINDNLCNIIQNRRNSISSVYNEENVSFCLIIDNSCVISEEPHDPNICYTEFSQDCLSELRDEIVSQHDKLEEFTASATNSLAIDSCEYSNAFSFNCGDKALEDSWVEDIACVETVISDDIAEDIVISGPSSPKVDHLSDNDESGVFDCSEHTDKVKYIYGGKMCSDDAQYVDALFNTPQMNVTKRLTQRETQDYEDYETLNDKLYYDRDSLEKLLSESNVSEPSFTYNYVNSVPPVDESYNTPNDKKSVLTEESSTDANTENICPKRNIDLIDNERENKRQKLYDETQDDTVHSCESSIDNVFSYKLEHKNEDTHRTSSSPEVSSTTSEEKSSTILLKITNYKGSRVSQINSVNSVQNSPSCKFTEEKDYLQCLPGHSTKRPLLTKAAQKYIPPLKESIRDLKVKLSLPQQSLLKLKQLKKCQDNLKKDVKSVSKAPVKPKPKFEDVLKSIDELQFQKHKESKKAKKTIPKVVIKKNENGSHYASTSRKNEYNPDLTGRKWQPWVFLEKDAFIDKMVIKNKNKAIFSHRKNTYVLAEKFKKYKSIHNAKFVITQPKSENSHRGLKYTIRLKHIY